MRKTDLLVGDVDDLLRGPVPGVRLEESGILPQFLKKNTIWTLVLQGRPSSLLKKVKIFEIFFLFPTFYNYYRGTNEGIYADQRPKTESKNRDCSLHAQQILSYHLVF